MPRSPAALQSDVSSSVNLPRQARSRAMASARVSIAGPVAGGLAVFLGLPIMIPPSSVRDDLDDRSVANRVRYLIAHRPVTAITPRCLWRRFTDRMLKPVELE